MTLQDVARSARDRVLRLTGRQTFGSAMRRHTRHPCFIPAKLALVDRGYMLDGAITEVSRGGLRFREASTYILDRRGSRISVALLGIAVEGVIVNLSSLGYGIRLASLLDEDYVDALVDLTPATAG